MSDNIDEVKILLSKLIKNRCINWGHKKNAKEIKNAKTLKSFFKKKGLKSTIYMWEKDRANLFLKIDSSVENVPTYGFITHLDVVPAKEDEWDFHPFSGREREKFILGRGSVDMLGHTATIAVAISSLCDKFKNSLPCNIRFYAFADEEAEGKMGADLFIKNCPELLDCDIFFSELGGFSLGEFDENSVAFINSEKGVARVKLLTTGEAAHGSMPYNSDNAILKMADILSKLEKEFCSFKATEAYKIFVEKLPSKLEKYKKNLLDKKLADMQIEKISKKSVGLAKYLNAASRTTISAGVVTGGTKVNIIPDKAVAELDVRCLQGETLESLTEKFEKFRKKEKNSFEYSITEWTPANSSDLKNRTFLNLMEKLNKKYSDKNFIPFISSGVSDGRYFRMLGKAVFGLLLYSDDITIDTYPVLLHGKNEKISVKSLESMYEFFYAILTN